MTVRHRDHLTPRPRISGPAGDGVERISSSRSPGVAGDGEAAVEIEGGADERQVREGLREVAEMLRLKTQLLAVQPEVIGVAEHFLEEEPRLVQVPHAGKALDVPEGAHR